MLTIIKNIRLTFITLMILTFAGFNHARAQMVVTNFPTPAGGSLCTVNEKLDLLYFALGNPGGNPVVVMNGATYSQTTVSANGNDVCVDPTNNNYWVSAVYADSATVWSSNNVALGSGGTGCGCAYGVNHGMDAPHRRVWVGTQCCDALWVFNADTYATVDGPISFGCCFSSIVVNPATGVCYVLGSGGSQRVDPTTFAVTANAFGQVLGANAPANLLYAVTNGNTLQIINGAPNPEVVLTNITLPFTYGSYVGVNPGLNRLYIGYNNTNIVAILNATTGQSIGNLSLGSGVTGVNNLVVDTTRNIVYANATRGGSPYVYVFQDYAIQPVIANITVSPLNPIIGAGTNLQFTATGYFSDGSTESLTNAGQVAWVSGSPGVASINTNGRATGLSLGTSTISASSVGITGNTLLTVVVQPTISTNPMSVSASSGGSATLSVSANGGDLTYQWAFDGTNIFGATGSSLTISNISLANIGSYTVTVSNPAGSVTSAAAALASVNIDLFAGVVLYGPLGSNYLIQASSNLLSNWTTLTNVTLFSQPYIYIDYSSPTKPKQFYRAVPNP